MSATRFSPGSIVVYKSDGYHSGNGEAPLTVFDISRNTTLRNAVHEYERGSVSAASLCSEIIEALFDKEFVGQGKHWDRDGASVTHLASSSNDEYVSYGSMCSATWDWKDIYAVASSKATIRVFLKKPEIHIVEYKYYVAG